MEKTEGEWIFASRQPAPPMPPEVDRLAGGNCGIRATHSTHDGLDLLRQANALRCGAMVFPNDEALPNDFHPQVRRAGAQSLVVFVQLPRHARDVTTIASSIKAKPASHCPPAHEGHQPLDDMAGYVDISQAKDGPTCQCRLEVFVHVGDESRRAIVATMDPDTALDLDERAA